MNETYYRRVQRGKSVRYEPVLAHETWDGYPEGYWLVHIRPGQKSVKRLVTPDHIGLQAAMEECRGAMVAAIQKAYSLHWEGFSFRKKPIPQEARDALDKARDLMNGQDGCWVRPCAVDAVEAGLRVVLEYMKEDALRNRQAHLACGGTAGPAVPKEEAV